MQTIDFIKGIGYEIISFPDGEKHLKINKLNRKDSVEIVCRICNSDDLFLLMQLSEILNRQCVTVEQITIPYLMTMRCDRLFSFEEAYSLRIVADIINSFKAQTVVLIEPHSDKSILLINSSFPKYLSLDFAPNNKNMIFCFPDKGAYARYSHKLYSKFKPIICSKVRNEFDGSLLEFTIEDKGDYKEGMSICVIDDLCDGGGTFIGIGNLLKEELDPENLILNVTHAIQQKGLEKVADVYDEVNITNSYKDWQDEEELPININVLKYY